jgi:hypothetical protein
MHRAIAQTRETRIHRATAHVQTRSAFCIECTAQQRSLNRRGMHRAEAHTLIPRSAICIEAGASTLTAWRPEPQPGASTANGIAAGAATLTAWRPEPQPGASTAYGMAARRRNAPCMEAGASTAPSLPWCGPPPAAASIPQARECPPTGDETASFSCCAVTEGRENLISSFVISQ